VVGTGPLWRCVLPGRCAEIRTRKGLLRVATGQKWQLLLPIALDQHGCVTRTFIVSFSLRANLGTVGPSRCGGLRLCPCHADRVRRLRGTTRAKEGGDGEVSEKSLENGTISGFLVPEEKGLAPFCPAGVARDEKDEKTTPTEAAADILALDREDKMEILV
jgi:hypothetical protein